MDKKQIENLNDKAISVTEENVEITQVTSSGNVVIHPVTKAKNVKYGNTNVQEVLDKKVCLDGEPQNFNFIDEGIVKDGLLSKDAILGEDDFYIYFEYDASKMTSAYIELFKFNSNFMIQAKAGVIKMYPIGLTQTLSVPLNKIVSVQLFRINNKVYLGVSNSTPSYMGDSYPSISTKYSYADSVKNVLTYNRPLTPQEIQHNFSALNNAPSIKELHTTDADGKTSILNFSSNENLVEMSTGRTLREEYMGVLKTMGKEFTSADGSAITVNNGIEARVISGEIKGQTVKNIAATNNTLKAIATTNTNVCKLLVNSEENKTYTIAFVAQDVVNNTKVLASVDGGWSHLLPLGGTSVKNGLNVFKIIPTKVSTGNNNMLSLMATDNAFKANYFMVLEGDFVNKITSYIPFGLNSTQAIISNNGQDYPIYEPVITGKTEILRSLKGQNNWEVISPDTERDTTTYDYKLDSINGDLGSAPSVYDYIDRARKVKILNTKEIVNYNEYTPRLIVKFTNVTRFWIDIQGIASGDKVVLSDKIKSYNNYSYDDIQPNVYSTANALVFFVPNSELTNKTVKDWLNENLPTVRYELATPQEIPLTDEEFKVYDKYKKIITLGAI